MQVQNYDRHFKNIIDNIVQGDQKPKLLLHVCCAPCATYCLTRLISIFDVTMYFSNNNITDRDEWEKRRKEVYKLCDIVNGGDFEVTPVFPLKVVTDDFCPARFFDIAKGFEDEREGGKRCRGCFEMRLKDTQQFALSNGFDFFCTTLTVSPYKNSNVLNEIGLSLQNNSVAWLSADFKKQDGYIQSIRLCQKYDIYRQHYCGCCFSQQQATTK